MSEVSTEILINAPAATIFPYLVEPDKFIVWMGTEVRLEPVPGGEFFVMAYGVHPAVGTFVEVVANEKVVFTLGWDEPNHPIPPGSTEVEITLSPRGEATLVRLVHRDLPEDATSDHHEGWSIYLGRLEMAMRGVTPEPDRAHEEA